MPVLLSVPVLYQRYWLRARVLCATVHTVEEDKLPSGVVVSSYTSEYLLERVSSRLRYWYQFKAQAQAKGKGLTQVTSF